MSIDKENQQKKQLRELLLKKKQKQSKVSAFGHSDSQKTYAKNQKSLKQYTKHK